MITWGSYPEVYKTTDESTRIQLLENFFNTFVLKDVVSIYNLKDTKLARDILQKIALQIGSEVSLREIDLILESYEKEYRTYEIKLSKVETKSFFPLEAKNFSINLDNYFEKVKEI